MADGKRGRAELDRGHRANLGQTGRRGAFGQATLVSDDPTDFLPRRSSAVLRGGRSQGAAASDRGPSRVALVEQGSAGPRYRFEIAVDLETETVAINGVGLDELNLLLKACSRYGC